MFKKFSIYMLLFAIPLPDSTPVGRNQLLLETIRLPSPSIVTLCALPLLRLTTPHRNLQPETGEDFRQQLCHGQSLDWFSHDQQGQTLDSGLYCTSFR